MIKVTTTYYKSSPASKWHNPLKFTPEIEAVYGTSYQLVTLLCTDTTMITEATWVDRATYDAFKLEPDVIAKYDELEAYLLANDIVLVSKTVE